MRLIKSVMLIFVFVMSAMVQANAAKPAEQIKDMDFMLGQWAVQRFFQDARGEWIAGDKTDAGFTEILGGHYIEGKYAIENIKYRFYISYDQNQERYRMVALADNGVMVIYDGIKTTNNNYLFDNVQSGTFQMVNGIKHYTRVEIKPVDRSTFEFHISTSKDNARSWTFVNKVVLSRKF